MQETKQKIYLFHIIFTVLLCSTFTQTWTEENANQKFGGFILEPPDASLVLNFPSDLVSLSGPNIAGNLFYRYEKIHHKGVISTRVNPLMSFTDSWHEKNYFPGVYFAVPSCTNKWAIGIAALRNYIVPTDLVDQPLHSLIKFFDTKHVITLYEYTLVAAYQFNQYFSFGAGVDFYKFHYQERKIIPNPGLDDATASTRGTDVKADFWGYHISATMNIPRYLTRIGIAYRSKATNVLKGDFFTFNSSLNPIQASSWQYETAKGLPLPAKIILQVAQPLTPCLVLRGTYQYEFSKEDNLVTFDSINTGKLTVPFGTGRNVPDARIGLLYGFSKNINLTGDVGWTIANYPKIQNRFTPNIYYLNLGGSFFVDNIKISLFYTHYFDFHIKSSNYRVLPVGNLFMLGTQRRSADTVFIQVSGNLN